MNNLLLAVMEERIFLVTERIRKFFGGNYLVPMETLIFRQKILRLFNDHVVGEKNFFDKNN